VLARVSGVFLGLPVLGSTLVPKRTRLLCALAVSAALLPALPRMWSADKFVAFLDMPGLLSLLASEFLLGFVVMLIVRFLLECMTVGGSIIDRNMGFGMARAINPALNASTTVVSVLFAQIFTVLFLTVNAHHDLIRLTAYSFGSVAPASFRLTGAMYEQVRSCGLSMFAEGFRMALPLFAMVLFVNICMAFMARFGREFNVLMLSFPLRIGLGMFVLFLTIPVVVHLCRDRIGVTLDIVAGLLRL